MRKLIAVAAVAALALLLNACGGSSDQPTTAMSAQKKQQAVNVIGWYVPGGLPNDAEVVRYSNGHWIRSVAASFIPTPKGIRLKIHPKAKVVRADLRYTYAPNGHVIPGHKYPQWDGKGFAPLTRTITTNNGKQRQLGLKEIYLRVYDPRFPDTYHLDR